MNSPSSLDPSAILDRILAAAAQNLRIEKILLQLGLDPSNVTMDFHNTVRRFREDPRVTLPYAPEQWDAVLALATS